MMFVFQEIQDLERDKKIIRRENLAAESIKIYNTGVRQWSNKD